jgi:hypothetical protein
MAVGRDAADTASPPLLTGRASLALMFTRKRCLKIHGELYRVMLHFCRMTASWNSSCSLANLVLLSCPILLAELI